MNSGFFILILLVLLVLWLLMVRPQQRRRRAQQAMIDGLRVGDEVLTAGGIFGTVRAIGEDEVTVELSPGAEARVSKRAIAAVLPPEDDEEGEGEEREPAVSREEVEVEREPPEQARR